MILLIALAFLAGIVTILSPCILPVLPVVLAGSVSGGKRKPLGVIMGFIGSFTFFTLTLTLITRLLGIPAEWLRWLAAGVMILFGLTMVVPFLKTQFEKLIRFSGGVSQQQSGEEGFKSGLLLGASLGLVWTPCVGPILATVLSLSLVGQVGIDSAVVMLSYAIGTSIPMFAIMYGGRELLNRQVWLKSNLSKIEKAFGILVVLAGLSILLSFDRAVQIWALRIFPGWGAGLTNFENIPSIDESLRRLREVTDVDYGRPMFELQGDLMTIAPDFIGGGPWLNSEPLSFQTNLKGRVVLVDFWTYSCINCIRSIPYVKKWYEKYTDLGFVVVGVHSPEFEFEKNTENVRRAIADLKIPYPVVQDNEFNIWNAYNNHYWPASYLISKEGKIVYMHFGEGEYAQTERQIVEALGVTGEIAEEEVRVPIRIGQTPEIYLGYERAANYEQNLREDRLFSYEFSGSPDPDRVALSGAWLSEDEYMESGEDGAFLELNFRANKVYLVMSTIEGVTVDVEVRVDGVEKERVRVDGANKYDVVDLGNTFDRHILRLIAPKGLRMYAFTFGAE